MIIVYLIILILAAIGSQCLVKFLVKKLNDKIKNTIPELEQKDKEFGGVSGFKKEAANLRLIFVKKKKLDFITKIIGFTEIILFVILTVLMFNFFNSIFEIISNLAKFAGGWIALKIIGNYQQWSGAVLGRAYFYTFLIGSIVNIVLAVIIGYVFSLLI